MMKLAIKWGLRILVVGGVVVTVSPESIANVWSGIYTACKLIASGVKDVAVEKAMEEIKPKMAPEQLWEGLKHPTNGAIIPNIYKWIKGE